MSESLNELLAKKAELDSKIEQLRKSARSEAIAQVKQIMADNGLTVEDITSGKARAVSSAKGGKIAPKYRNSETGETWTGRGLKPKWIENAIASGKKLEDFLI